MAPYRGIRWEVVAIWCHLLCGLWHPSLSPTLVVLVVRIRVIIPTMVQSRSTLGSICYIVRSVCRYVMYVHVRLYECQCMCLCARACGRVSMYACARVRARVLPCACAILVSGRLHAFQRARVNVCNRVQPLGCSSGLWVVNNVPGQPHFHVATHI